MTDDPLLAIDDLCVEFFADQSPIRAVDGLSLVVHKGESVALVGESGSGKSVTALSVLSLLPDRAARIRRGSIRFEGRELVGMPDHELREVRGGRIGMVFQEPMTSLNPVHTIGAQVREALQLHRRISRRQAWREAVAMLEAVGFPMPRERFGEFPHELSGGLRQRVMLAMALICEPSLLIADEPTTALDTTVQAQFLALIRDLQSERGMASIFITHDLTLVPYVADRVVVMYAGQIVEDGRTDEVLAAPAHPYTQGLLASVPPVGAKPRTRGDKGRRLPSIAGAPPDPRELPPGCRFHPRCHQVLDRCDEQAPNLYPRADQGRARCFLIEPGRASRGSDA